MLNLFAQLPTPENDWDAVGDNLCALRGRGVTVPLSDVVIATVAISHDVELWTRDTHFALMLPHLPALKLFQEPP
jgi:predicted nucleic acid-binding protein